MGQLGARDLGVTTTKQKIPIWLFSASQKTAKGKLRIRISNSARVEFFKAGKPKRKYIKQIYNLQIRSKKWAVNRRRKDLIQKDAEYLYRNVRICSAHFEDEMFVTESKKTLKITAIPTLSNIPNPPSRIGVKCRLVRRKEAPDLTCTTSECFLIEKNPQFAYFTSAFM